VIDSAAHVVRSPASSANLGAGFDVFGMALSIYADIGTGEAPDGTQPLDEHHPARIPFHELGGQGALWMKCEIPMARGLGFSGAVRVGAAALAAVQNGRSIEDASPDILHVAARLEGHGDNVAASVKGGVVAYVDGVARRFVLGPTLAAASVVAWVPDVTTSTDRSRTTLPAEVSRTAAVANIGRATQFALAFAYDDPELLVGSTRDELHQPWRLPLVDGAADAIDAGVASGAWCAWLSGSGPTVSMLVPADRVDSVTTALPGGGHIKTMSIDVEGVRRL
jgi:homoserine kinase